MVDRITPVHDWSTPKQKREPAVAVQVLVHDQRLQRIAYRR